MGNSEYIRKTALKSMAKNNPDLDFLKLCIMYFIGYRQQQQQNDLVFKSYFEKCPFIPSHMCNFVTVVGR